MDKFVSSTDQGGHLVGTVVGVVGGVVVVVIITIIVIIVCLKVSCSYLESSNHEHDVFVRLITGLLEKTCTDY